MTLNPSMDGLQERVAAALKRHTTYFLVEGIVLIILGLVAIAVPFIATLTFTIFFGWLLLISGVVGLVSTFSLRPAAVRFEHDLRAVGRVGRRRVNSAALRQSRRSSGV